MIFVTVGTQLPFDRLVGTVDRWSSRSREAVFAQIGPSQQSFKNIETVPFLTPEEASDRFAEASVIIAHAGMGTILTALTVGSHCWSFRDGDTSGNIGMIIRWRRRGGSAIVVW